MLGATDAMDFVSFITEMARILVWPATVFAIVFLLRRPIIRLVPFLEELKYKEFSLKFKKEITEAKKQIETKAPSPMLLEDLDQIQDHLGKLAWLSPRATVMESWIYLHDKFLKIATEAHLIEDKNSRIGDSKLGSVLLENENISESDLGVFNQLRKLRNEAAHAPDFAFSTALAQEYADVATRLAFNAKLKNST